MKTWALGAAVAVVGGALAACTVSTSTGGTGAFTGTGAHTTTTTHIVGTGGHGTTTSGTTTTGTTTTTGDPCTTPASGADCAMCANRTLCFNCLATADMAGNDKANQLVLDDCGCASGSTCFSSCMGDPSCNNPAMNPSQACVTCLNGLASTDACIKTVQTACLADANCKIWITDAQGCPAK